MSPSPSGAIKVIGVGDAGNHMINRLIDEGISRIDLIAANSYFQALLNSKARIRIQLGREVTNGQGAGGNAELGRRSAEAVMDELYEVLYPARTVYIIGGMGGGTGSGAAPVIARVAQNLHAQTVAVVTRPFSFEGEQRKQIADRAIEILNDQVNEVVELHNDHLLPLTANLAMQQTFSLAAGAAAWEVILRLAKRLP